MSDPTMHIYAQWSWHMEAVIAGDMDSLMLLRDAINAALEHGAARMVAFCADGEGYDVCVCVHDVSMEPLPYVDPVAQAWGPANAGTDEFKTKISDAMLRRVPNAPR